MKAIKEQEPIIGPCPFLYMPFSRKVSMLLPELLQAAEQLLSFPLE